MKKILCIDGNSILNRQFYGIRFLSAKDGFPTNAIFGFVNVLTKQLEALSPDYLAVAFDLKATTFRHKMYDEYKAGRRPSPEELIKQFPVAKDILTAMGIKYYEIDNYEADDIIGTFSEYCNRPNDNYEGVIISSDKDLLQLISKDNEVKLLKSNDYIRLDEKTFIDIICSYNINFQQLRCWQLLHSKW